MTLAAHSSQRPLTLQPLKADLLPAAVALDQCCLGGLWTLAGYQRELNSPNSCLLGLTVDTSQSQPLSAGCTSNKGNRPGSDSRCRLRGQQPRLLGLGCLWAILEEAHITILAIHPDYRRQGFGQAILYSLLVEAQRRRLEWATLEVRSSNQIAIALYEKFGFQKVGHRRRYYPDTGEDALILWCRGLQEAKFQQQLHQWRTQIQATLVNTGWHLSLPCPSVSLGA